MTTVKPHTITLKQKFAIGTRLRAVLVERTDGLWEYADGYTDATVAAEFDVPKYLVTSVRVRTFGKLANAVGGRIPGTSEPSANMKRRVRAIEDYLDTLDPKWRAQKQLVPKE